MTSERASRPGTREAPGISGSATRVPSASGTRTNWPWHPSTGRPWASGSPKKLPCAHDVVMPRRQWIQLPSLIENGAMTKEPGGTVRTSAPASSTTPTISCPMRLADSVCHTPRYGHRSDPQMQAATTRTTASVGSRISGSGTSSARMSRGPYNSVASMPGSSPDAGRLTSYERRRCRVRPQYQLHRFCPRDRRSDHLRGKRRIGDRSAVDVGDRARRESRDPRPGQDDPGEIEGIGGREPDGLAVVRLPPHRAKQVDGLSERVLLPREPGDEAAAPDGPACLHPAQRPEHVPPRHRQRLAGQEVA